MNELQRIALKNEMRPTYDWNHMHAGEKRNASFDINQNARWGACDAIYDRNQMRSTTAIKCMHTIYGRKHVHADEKRNAICDSIRAHVWGARNHVHDEEKRNAIYVWSQ